MYELRESIGCYSICYKKLHDLIIARHSKSSYIHTNCDDQNDHKVWIIVHDIYLLTITDIITFLFLKYTSCDPLKQQ